MVEIRKECRQENKLIKNYIYTLKETTELLKEEGVPEDRILQVFGDTREEKTLHDLVDKTVERFGGIDILVNFEEIS